MASDSDESRERLETRSESSAERDDGPVERDGDPVEARPEDALERVAHGATISVPSILLQRGLTFAFTAMTLERLGFTPVERRLAASLGDRYREAFAGKWPVSAR